MTRTLRMASLLLAAQVGGTFVVGCGPKTGARTAADEELAPPPPSDESIQKAQKERDSKAQAKTALSNGEGQAPAAAPIKGPAKASKREPKKGIEHADFDKLVAKWEDQKKAGPLSRDAAKSLAGKFASLAGSQAELAAEAHFNAGTLLDQAGDAKGAESEYQAALGANPAYGPALNNLGEIYYRTGSPQRAKEWFEKAIKADPTHNAPAYNNLAVILFQEAKEQNNPAAYKDAVSKLRRALAIDNDSMPAYALLALIYYTTAENDRSKLELATLVCKQAKEANDKYAPIYNTLGLIQLRKRNVSLALKEFEKAIELDPRYIEAHLNIGAIGLSSRQYEKAEKSFSEVLKLKPESVEATIGIGVALRGQKKFDEAEKYYKRAKELDPKNCAVAYNMGVLYQDYKSDAANQNLRDAQKFYGEFVSCGGKDKRKVEDAQRRIKDIDDTFAALEQQKKMEAELKAQQEEMEKQQKQMEEQQKQQQNAPAPPAASK